MLCFPKAKSSRLCIQNPGPEIPPTVVANSESKILRESIEDSGLAPCLARIEMLPSTRKRAGSIAAQPWQLEFDAFKMKLVSNTRKDREHHMSSDRSVAILISREKDVAHLYAFQTGFVASEERKNLVRIKTDWQS